MLRLQVITCHLYFPHTNRNLAQIQKLQSDTHLGGKSSGGRASTLSSSFFSLASRGGRILGLSFSSRFRRSLSHSSLRRSRSLSRSLSLSRCRRSLSRWSRSLSLSRWRSRGSCSLSRSCQQKDPQFTNQASNTADFYCLQMMH